MADGGGSCRKRQAFCLVEAFIEKAVSPDAIIVPARLRCVARSRSGSGMIHRLPAVFCLIYARGMISLEQYKTLLGDRLNGLTEYDIRCWHESHTTFAAFILKKWRAQHGLPPSDRDRVAP